MSAFVTFHMFVLPAIRKYCGYGLDKLSMPIIPVQVKKHLKSESFFTICYIQFDFSFKMSDTIWIHGQSMHGLVFQVAMGNFTPKS